MKYSTKLHHHHITNEKIVLTIGFFDGMHLGHQHLIKKVNDLKGDSGFSYVVSFSNHPTTILKPDNPTPLICSTQHRKKLIQEQGIDSLIMLPFNEKLKELTPDEFISWMLENLEFTDLVLGPDSTIGKDKEGDFELLKLLAKKYNFKLHRVDFVKAGKYTVSSTLIRKKIDEGDLELATKFLGRPYSLLDKVQEGEAQGRQIGFPTLNIETKGLCIPPLGVYKVTVCSNGQDYLGIANLGFAPSLKERESPLLEVHLLQDNRISYGDLIDVQFHQFIREEKIFSSKDELRDQIQKDILKIQAS